MRGETVEETNDDDVVVVIIPRIAGDSIIGTRLFPCGEIVEREGNDRATTRKDFAGVASPFGVSFEPLHITGMSFFDPAEVVIGMGSPGCGGDAAVVEAKLSGDELHVGFDDAGVHLTVLKWYRADSMMPVVTSSKDS